MSSASPKPRQRFLIAAAYAPRTLKDYKSAIDQFFQWCRDHEEEPATLNDLDECFADFLHDLYEERGGTGAGKGIAKKAHAALVLALPECKRSLPLSCLALRGWARRRPTCSYPPLNWDLTCLISVKLAAQGNLRLAIGVLLAFDCWLRISEVAGLVREDFADAKDPRLGSSTAKFCSAVRLRHTKTGPNRFVTLSNAVVTDLVSVLASKTKPGARLFPFKPDQMRKALKKACAALGLSPDYTFHSFRHGGTTKAFIEGVPMADIIKRGRWNDPKSAQTYIQSGPALLLATQVPQEVAALAAEASKSLLELLALSQKH